MNDQPEFFDPAAFGLGAYGRIVEPAKPRGKRPRLTPEKKAERKAAKGAKRPARSSYEAQAALITDPEAREIKGRRLHAELGERKAAMIAERQALLDRPAYDSETLGADLDWERFRVDWHENGREGAYVKECNRVFREASALYVGECERLRREIERLSAEQIDISHAYARPELLAGYAAMSPWVEAAAAEAERQYRAESVAIIKQWIEEGARLVTIDMIPDPTKAPAANVPAPARRQLQRLYVTPPAASAPVEAPVPEDDLPRLVEPETEAVVRDDPPEEPSGL